MATPGCGAGKGRPGRLSRLSELVVLEPSRRVTLEAWRLLQWTPDGRGIVTRLLPLGMSLAALAEYSTLRAGKERESNATEAGAPAPTGAAPGSTAVVYPRRPPGLRGESADRQLFIARHRHFLGDLALVDLGTGQARRLASRVHAERYNLSPDGRHLAFYDEAALHIVQIATGQEVATDRVEPDILPRVDLTWAPTSDYVLHLVDGALRRVDVSGSTSQVPNATLTSLPVWSRNEQAFYAVDGARILRLNETRPFDVVATLDQARFAGWILDDERQRTLFEKPGTGTIWLWTRASDAAPQRLQAVSVATGTVARVTRRPGLERPRARAARGAADGPSCVRPARRRRASAKRVGGVAWWQTWRGCRAASVARRRCVRPLRAGRATAHRVAHRRWHPSSRRASTTRGL